MVSNPTGVYQLHAWDVLTGRLIELTHEPNGRLFALLAPDGRHVYSFVDQEGSERGHYVRLPLDGGAEIDLTPELPPYTSLDLTLAGASPRGCFTYADADGYHVYRLDQLDTDGPVVRDLTTRDRPLTRPTLSADGAYLAVAVAQTPSRTYDSVVILDTDTAEEVGRMDADPHTSLQPILFAPAPDDPRLLVTSNRTGWLRPLLWNIRLDVHQDLLLGELEGDVVPLDWSSDGREILLRQWLRAEQQLYVYEVKPGRLRRLDHPSGSFGFSVSFFTDSGAYLAPSGEIFALWSDVASAPRLIGLDHNSGRQTRIVLDVGTAPPGRPWRSVTFPSSDGQLVQGWLGTPGGAGPWPAIVQAHGGPNVVTADSFSASVQAWLDNGFAVLSVNYRGSTTFGRQFEEAILGRPGYWEVEDLVAAHRWLVTQGLADPARVFVEGWSYGGLLVLLALGTYPTLWAGGVARVAIGDCVAAYEDSPAWLQRGIARRFGGTPDEQPMAWAEGSPTTYAERLTAPVLVIQGRNDARCPPRQMERYAARLEALGKPIDIHWLDTGHVGPRALAEQAIRFQELMLDWSARWIDQE